MSSTLERLQNPGSINTLQEVLTPEQQRVQDIIALNRENISTVARELFLQPTPLAMPKIPDALRVEYAEKNIPLPESFTLFNSGYYEFGNDAYLIGRWRPPSAPGEIPDPKGADITELVVARYKNGLQDQEPDFVQMLDLTLDGTYKDAEDVRVKKLDDHILQLGFTVVLNKKDEKGNTQYRRAAKVVAIADDGSIISNDHVAVSQFEGKNETPKGYDPQTDRYYAEYRRDDDPALWNTIFEGYYQGLPTQDSEFVITGKTEYPKEIGWMRDRIGTQDHVEVRYPDGRVLKGRHGQHVEGDEPNKFYAYTVGVVEHAADGAPTAEAKLYTEDNLNGIANIRYERNKSVAYSTASILVDSSTFSNNVGRLYWRSIICKADNGTGVVDAPVTTNGTGDSIEEGLEKGRIPTSNILLFSRSEHAEPIPAI